jgi:hypothetical protein
MILVTTLQFIETVRHNFNNRDGMGTVEYWPCMIVVCLCDDGSLSTNATLIKKQINFPRF